MKKTAFLFSFLTIIFCFHANAKRANAGFLIEPYVGYKKGSYDFTFSNLGAPDDGDYTYDYSGIEYGLKAGYQIRGFFGGVGYGLGSVKEDKISKQPSGSSLTGTDKYDVKMLSLFAGYQLPVMFRVWASYYLNHDWEVAETNADTGAEEGDKYKLSGFSVGVGFTGLPLIAINLEYRMFNIDKTEVDGITTSLPTSFTSKPDVKEIFVSLSVPLNL